MKKIYYFAILTIATSAFFFKDEIMKQPPSSNKPPVYRSLHANKNTNIANHPLPNKQMPPPPNNKQILEHANKQMLKHETNYKSMDFTPPNSQLIRKLSTFLPKTTQSYSQQPLKILVLGDSLLFGYNLPEKEKSLFLINDYFHQQNIPINLVQASISGSTTSSALERLQLLLSQPNNISGVILALGGNDLLRTIPPQSVKKNLEQSVRYLIKKNKTIMIAGMKSSKANGQKYEESFNDAFSSIAKKYQLTFLPFLLKDIATKPKYNQEDGIHPNEAGARMLAKNLIPYIYQLAEQTIDCKINKLQSQCNP